MILFLYSTGSITYDNSGSNFTVLKSLLNIILYKIKSYLLSILMELETINTQRELSEKVDCSVGTVNSILKLLINI